MSYINVNIDVDIDDIIDSLSKSEKLSIIKNLSDKDLLDAIKQRGLQAVKSVNINEFTMLNNYQKREAIIKLLDLPSYSNDTDILDAVKSHI